VKSMKTRLHPITVVLALAVLGFAIYIGYVRKLQSMSPAVPPQMMEPRPAPAYDEGLGAMLQASPETKSHMIVGFRPSAAASPLAMLGCFPGDVLVSCNGAPVTGTEVRKAIEEMEKKHKPIVLEVYRGGEKIELKHEKMPAEPAIYQRLKAQGRPVPSGHR